MVHYDFNNSADTARLKHLLSRAERNLISYDKCDLEELAGFCKSRGLAVRGEEDVTSLITILERADEEATFERFDALPAELRVHIYRCHFESFTDGLEAPVQPPITKVSKLSRKEALPLFYHSSTFTIKIDRFEDEYAKSNPQRCFTSAEFWDTDFRRKPRRSGHQCPSSIWPWSLGFGSSTSDKMLTLRHTSYTLGWGAYDKSAYMVYKGQEKALQRLLDQMAARPEGKQLQRGDVKQFVDRFGVDGWQGYDDGDDFHLFTEEEGQSTEWRVARRGWRSGDTNSRMAKVVERGSRCGTCNPGKKGSGMP
ncbi:hypothetical protein LTR85_006691 [Meristemomyces frigidus]|nr:hypothetical protein LTR85_006691 [Meristemomyces frigidus]